MANFKNTGDIYVSKSGSDANPGTDPDLPKLTINAAMVAAVNPSIIVVGDGIYQEKNIDLKSGVTILADGIVIMEGDGTIDPAFLGFDASSTHKVIGVTFVNYVNIYDNQGGGNTHRNNFFTNNIYVGGFVSNAFDDTEGGIAQQQGDLSGNRYVNTTHEVVLLTTVNADNYKECVYEGNSILKFVQASPITIVTAASNIHFGPNTLIDCPTVDYLEFLTFCNIEGQIKVAGVTYPSLEDLRITYPTAFPNSINQSALFNTLSGEVETLDFTVQGSSPLLGAGENGTNIGAVKRGLPQSRLSASVQNGTNTNIVFDGNVWQVQAGQTTGSIETDVIDFGLTVKSPKLTVKGLVNFLDNVPDFDNTLLNPNKLDIEARYAIIGEDIILKTYKPFLLNERILLDVGGLSNGEALFDWANTVTQPMKEIQLRITLRQDYNPA